MAWSVLKGTKFLTSSDASVEVVIALLVKGVVEKAQDKEQETFKTPRTHQIVILQMSTHKYQTSSLSPNTSSTSLSPQVLFHCGMNPSSPL